MLNANRSSMLTTLPIKNEMVFDLPSLLGFVMEEEMEESPYLGSGAQCLSSSWERVKQRGWCQLSFGTWRNLPGICLPCPAGGGPRPAWSTRGRGAARGGRPALTMARRARPVAAPSSAAAPSSHQAAGHPPPAPRTEPTGRWCRTSSSWGWRTGGWHGGVAIKRCDPLPVPKHSQATITRKRPPRFEWCKHSAELLRCGSPGACLPCNCQTDR